MFTVKVECLSGAREGVLCLPCFFFFFPKNALGLFAVIFEENEILERRDTREVVRVSFVSFALSHSHAEPAI